MMNPNMYLSDVWNEEEETPAANARASRTKNEPRLPHGRGRFTYTIVRLQSGCLLYQLALTKQIEERRAHD